MTTKIINPYSGDVVAEIKTSTGEDVQVAIGRAVDEKKTLANMPVHERASILTRAADIIALRRQEIAELITHESGKPIRYALGEVNRCTETLMFAADAARSMHGETLQMSAATGGVGKFGYYVRVPVGVVGAITPFNFPLNLVAHKVAPAVAAGCPIVLKPSPDTPLTALKLAEIMHEAGLPAGGLEVVVGDVEVGKALTTDKRVAMLTFTGSPGVAEAISKVVGLRKATYELGGNAATIIERDANLSDALINRLAVGSFAYSGQVCISVQRIYIHASLYDEFKERFVARTKTLSIGDPLAAETEIGPMITPEAAKRVELWVEEAASQGANILCGGKRDGQVMLPTVLENVADHMRVMCHELFGPVVNIIPFDDFEAALAAADASEFGLQAGLYTNDLNKIMRCINTLDVGGVIINDVPTFRVDQMPYGGNKRSGVGREGPRFAIEDMTTLKMVVINHN
ncbi:MAG: aldehyde dehydrogenase family protein [Chloroflexota bacterium]